MRKKSLQHTTEKSAPLEADRVAQLNARQQDKTPNLEVAQGGFRERNLSGMKFFRRTAINMVRRVQSGKTRVYWICKCECGKIDEVESYSLRFGGGKSCGCLLIDVNKAKATHGASRNKSPTQEYRTWLHMNERCRNPKSKSWSNYGGRGITICERWGKFENFLLDMGMRPSPDHSIERVNNNGNYKPSNCIWGTRKQQANNNRFNREIEFDGKVQNASQWAEQLKTGVSTITARLDKLGWSVEKTITTPVRKLVR